MTKKQIRELAQKSYDANGKLDEKKALQIADKLKRLNLKFFIKELKKEEERRSVIIETPTVLKDQILKSLKDVFPGKKVILRKNPELISGVRVINNDLIYDLNLQNNFDKIIQYLEKSYD